MGKKDKKKGKGAEKTALKTEKKALARMKRELAAKGEGDIEKLIAKSQKQGGKHGEEPCSQPGPRSAFTLSPHPDKEELILFGGEYYTGSKTSVYNELYFYNIKKGTWSRMNTPLNPPPRCAHQAVVLSQNGGQLWIFGGEFVSPTRTVFYHYKDLWVFHLAEKRWEEIKAPGGPSARSGHRMVVRKKQIVVFGGFHETFENYTYLNDLYVFNLETYTWSKIEPVGKIPSLRSASLFAPLTDGRILLYGGYYRQKVKKGVDKGSEFTDMYHLHVDERSVPHKWKWLQVKPSGIPPSARTGLSIAVAPNNRAYVFGGVHDDEVDEENLLSMFHNDLYALELDTGRWFPINLRGKKSRGGRKRHKRSRNAAAAAASSSEDDDESEEVVEVLKKTTLADDVEEISTMTDDVFTVKILPGTSDSGVSNTVTVSSSNEAFLPKGRMGAILVVKNGILYLYGGFYEEGDRRYTLSDFYSLDIHKLDEWRTIVPFSISHLDWVESSESESEESGEENDEDDDEEEEEEEDDDDDEEDSEEMETD
ncbi:Kelch domain-containing protein 4 [Argiope bruennichi]|uniref:Kelch domain-containing protein 4 n=1 Tax=Argiope bruennichi TaxID=94029 RepID=A0A8T0EH05_ARGBR|nr:Kelch domain-containing protein 4 [Argiope bruennichi]